MTKTKTVCCMCGKEVNGRHIELNPILGYENGIERRQLIDCCMECCIKMVSYSLGPRQWGVLPIKRTALFNVLDDNCNLKRNDFEVCDYELK